MPSINLGRVKGDKGVSMRNRGEWNSTAKYLNDDQYIDFVSHNGSLWTCLTTNTNIEPSDTANVWDLAVKSIDTVYFQQASKRENIVSGEAASTLFGKISKWFADLKSAAFYSVVNNLLTTEAGVAVLDAYQGKLLNDRINELNSKIESEPLKFDVSSTADDRVVSAQNCYYDPQKKRVHLEFSLYGKIPRNVNLISYPSTYAPRQTYTAPCVLGSFARNVYVTVTPSVLHYIADNLTDLYVCTDYFI